MADLARLACSDDPAHRDELLVALGALCALAPLEDVATDAAVSEIMQVLYPRAREDVRKALSQKLCKTAWAAHPLITTIARDVPPIARAVIVFSPVLVDADIIDLATEMGLDHRLMIAERPHISEAVTDVLVRHDEPQVLVAVVENGSANLSMQSFASCVRVSRRVELLRTRLSVRDDMPRSLIPSLFAYSDEPLRRQIADRFKIDEAHLSDVVKEAIAGKNRHMPPSPGEKMEAAAKRLVDKLAQSERLTSSFVVKALNDRKFILFEQAMARLSGVGVEQMRAALHNDPLYALSLGCRAARMDRSVFPVIHAAMQAAGREIAPIAGEDGSKAAAAFGNHSPAAAAVALRLLSRNA